MLSSIVPLEPMQFLPLLCSCLSLLYPHAPFAYPSSPRATRQQAKSRSVTPYIFKRMQTPHLLTSVVLYSYKRLGGIAHFPRTGGCGLYLEPAQLENGLYLEPAQ